MAINLPPTPDRSDQGIGRMAQAAEAHRLDLDGDPRVAGDSFVRYWPPNPGNGAPGDGNTQGFLRYLTRNPGAPLQCDCPGGFSLTLDRMVTAPNAAIGVCFLSPTPYKQNWALMYPGDTIYVPGGFERFWIFNADNVDALTVATVSKQRPHGYAGFLIGTRRNGTAPYQTSVHPSFSSCATFILGAQETSSCYLPIGRGRRVALIGWGLTSALAPVGAGGATLAFVGNFIPPVNAQAVAGAVNAFAADSQNPDYTYPGGFDFSAGPRRTYRLMLPAGGLSYGGLTLNVPTGQMLRMQSPTVNDWAGGGIANFFLDAVVY